MWFPSGRLEAEHRRPRSDGGRESESWYEDGSRETLECPNLSASFDRNGNLISLGADAPIPKDDLARLGELRVAGQLMLSRPGIDDEVLASIAGLEGLTELTLRRTGVSATGIRRLRVCKNLSELDTCENALFESSDVKELLAGLPDCDWLDRDTLLARLEEDTPGLE